MALTPNVPFSDGDAWTPELAYAAFNSPVYDDQPQYLGHRQKIQDSELSDNASAIKTRFTGMENALKVSVESGLTLRYQSGAVRVPDGSQFSLVGGLVSAPDNSTSYVYVDINGTVFCAVNVPVQRLVLAKVITVAGQVSSLEDWRSLALRAVQPLGTSIKVFGGSSTADKVCSQGEIFDLGFYYFRDFTVPAGVSITVDKWARIFCSGVVNILGTVNVTPLAAGAAPFAIYVNTNGGGGGGLSGAGAGAGSGSSAYGGSPYSYGAQAYGSGGGLGFVFGNVGASTVLGAGGRGGGGLWIEAADYVYVSGTINAKGENGSSGSVSSGTASISGSGAGSGGLVLLSSLRSVTATTSAVLDVRGGNGGTAITNITGASVMGGSGGGGGQVALISPTNNTTGATILLSGGSRGTDVGTTPQNLGGGGGGGFGGQGGQQSSGSVGKLIIRNFVPIGN